MRFFKIEIAALSVLPQDLIEKLGLPYEVERAILAKKGNSPLSERIVAVSMLAANEGNADVQDATNIAWTHIKLAEMYAKRSLICNETLSYTTSTENVMTQYGNALSAWAQNRDYDEVNVSRESNNNLYELIEMSSITSRAVGVLSRGDGKDKGSSKNASAPSKSMVSSSSNSLKGNEPAESSIFDLSKMFGGDGDQ